MSEKTLVQVLEGRLDKLLDKLDPDNFEKLTLGQISTAIGIIYDRIQKEKAKDVQKNPFEGMSDDEIEKISGQKIVRLKDRQNANSFRGEYKKKKDLVGASGN